ncbi:MAG: 4-hydroxy-3-methylbut-2-enyl diphosphate reductase, partial [Akkermansia sp.]|nr:4-hydroxy-3-methylbut-2-enyl diphosphate reductase [Akkermansia sp.]
METAKVNRPVNVRRPEVMGQVAEDLAHFQSTLVESLRQQGNELELPGVRLFLAESFGFCDGVKRAIEIAYAACRLFKGRRIWLIGEIIHNPDVNARLDALGMLHLPWKMDDPAYDALTAEDVVIMPAFGVPVSLRNRLDAKGVTLVDSTCGNVIKVW